MEELLEKNKRLLLENAGLREKLTHIIKERNFWQGVACEVWERLNKAMVRRE